MPNFVLIVNNEVAGNYFIKTPENLDTGFNQAMEKMIAILSSNPTIVQTEEKVEEGYIWDGQNFISPTE
jgi:hypothetical protein